MRLALVFLIALPLACFSSRAKEAPLYTRYQTTFYELKDANASLDVGAIAKGYAVQKAGEAAILAGAASFLINAGGNVAAIGTPIKSGDDAWSVGIKDPAVSGDFPLFDVISLTNASCATARDDQRYYTVGGVKYHHLIDPQTLLPGTRYHSVPVVHENAAVADMLSTALFLLPKDEGERLLLAYHADALWIFPDYTAQASAGYRELSRQKFRAL